MLGGSFGFLLIGFLLFLLGTPNGRSHESNLSLLRWACRRSIVTPPPPFPLSLFLFFFLRKKLEAIRILGALCPPPFFSSLSRRSFRTTGFHLFLPPPPSPPFLEAGAGTGAPLSSVRSPPKRDRNGVFFPSFFSSPPSFSFCRNCNDQPRGGEHPPHALFVPMVGRTGSKWRISLFSPFPFSPFFFLSLLFNGCLLYANSVSLTIILTSFSPFFSFFPAW